ncbi:acetylxylanesterase aceA [Camillea tinctor]|nr:acetylxylanesterase aceA [Camillea tinctor]
MAVSNSENIYTIAPVKFIRATRALLLFIINHYLKMLFLGVLLTLLFSLSRLSDATELVKRGSLEQVTDFGDNPTGARMYIYVPEKLVHNPPIVVAVHYCSASAEIYFSGTPYAKLADTHGFIVLYPESTNEGACWDVSSDKTMIHNGGGDSNSIASMIRHTIKHYKSDTKKVFVMGSSSGAMMTNILAATYPELFAAASVYAGAPAGCFYTGTVAGWNSTCAQGEVVGTQEYWANVAKSMYPGYEGLRPRMRIYHGSADTTLYPQNYQETIKQWTGIFGYTDTPKGMFGSDPADPYTRYAYGENVEGAYGIGITHNLNMFGHADLEWFGI